ncbi:MAG: FadR/GntR family transcriptional regulator [Streptosporangiaceae bacterium]
MHGPGAGEPGNAPSAHPRGQPQPGGRRRAPQGIAAQIRALVHAGRLRPGDRLPPERELCERYSVSRVTVREALRVLEASGLVAIKVGSRGGTFVTAPSEAHVVMAIQDYLALTEPAPDAVDLRQSLEAALTLLRRPGPEPQNRRPRDPRTPPRLSVGWDARHEPMWRATAPLSRPPRREPGAAVQGGRQGLRF